MTQPLSPEPPAALGPAPALLQITTPQLPGSTEGNRNAEVRAIVHQATPEHSIAAYETCAETYRQHVDMMLRCIAVYLAIVGTATGFIFTDGAAPERRDALSAFVGIVSAISLVGCSPALRWIRAIEASMRGYENDLKLRPFPLGGIRDIVAMFGGLALTILLVSMALLSGML